MSGIEHFVSPDSPDIFLTYRTSAYRPHHRRAQVTATVRHVDNPADHVKFRRVDKMAGDYAEHENRREVRGEFDGGCRGANLTSSLV
jgi:hypothetical protein